VSGTPGLNPRSGMISLDLPQGAVKPVPGGVDDHHVTVVYLGPDVDDAAFARACQRARDAAAGMSGPLKGSVGGVDSFPPSDSSDGKRPAFAPVRLPGAGKLRSRLEDLSASEHKDWVPHVTLAYVGKGDPLPPAVPRTPVTFTHLSVHRGGDVKRFPLGGKAPALANAGRAVNLSADTARLAVTPSPAGKPGGPGLYHVKGMSLPPYFQHVRDALIRSGHPPAVAYAITWGAIRRWARGGGKAHPEVVAAAQAALADLAAKSAVAHAHANETGGAVSLTWNGHAIDLATVDLGGYMPPHVPAGSPKGGQFGTTSGKGASSGGTAGKTAAQQHADHMAHIAHLQHLVATGQATPAQKAELAGLLKALNAPKGKPKPKPGTAAATEAAAAAAIAAHPLPDAVKKKAAAKPKPKAAGVKAAAAAKPVVDRKKGTVTATIGGKRVTMTLAQWHARHVAHLQHAAHLKAVAARAKTAKLASDGGRFLDLAIADALTVPGPEVRRLVAPVERVPPGVREGGQFTPRPPQFTRHDTPERTAEVVNSMGPAQRARVRATILCPPGFEWQAGDKLAAATP
jgi:2'-5' RNA ligase